MNNDDDYSFCFTQPNTKDERSLFRQIKKLITEAVENETYLLLCSFYLNNFEVIDLLKKASGPLQGKIYVIVGNTQNSYSSFNAELEPKKEGFSSLTEHGILIRCVKNAHLKFITNGIRSLICSTNMTADGLFRNPEFGVMSPKKKIAISLNRIFFYLWFIKSSLFFNQGNWIEIPVFNRKFPSSFQTKKSPSSPDSKLLLNSNTAIQDLNKNEKIVSDQLLFDILIETLISAKKSIDIAVYNLILNSKPKLKQIKEILGNKARDSVKVRILVPAVKVNYSEEMRRELRDLHQNNISIRYYRELHGKCVIIDNSKVLFMTGNLDPYLLRNNSYDLGYLSTQQTIVENINSLYNHLWAEAAEECNINIPINLHLDLSVKSYDFISFRPPISIKKLEKIIEECESITLFLHETNSLLLIQGAEKRLNIFFEQVDTESLEYTGDILNISGMIDHRIRINKKQATNFSVKKLDLRLFWQV